MTTVELLTALQAWGVVLTACNGRLKVDAPKDVVTPELLAMLIKPLPIWDDAYGQMVKAIFDKLRAEMTPKQRAAQLAIREGLGRVNV